MGPKSTYIVTTRRLRTGLKTVGLLDRMDRWAEFSRVGQWARSLLAAYDLEDFARLDIPWWTYQSIDRVAAFLDARESSRVLEWGSGASTIWLARRATSVISIEHDESWAAVLSSYLPPNATVRHVPARAAPAGKSVVRSSKKGYGELDFTSYVAATEGIPGLFDLVVIDGRAREACLAEAVDKVADDGLILFDNVERRRYRVAIAGFSDRLFVEWTQGLTPILPYPTRTALLRKRPRTARPVMGASGGP